MVSDCLVPAKEESIPSRAGESIPGICKEWLASIVVLTT